VCFEINLKKGKDVEKDCFENFRKCGGIIIRCVGIRLKSYVHICLFNFKKAKLNGLKKPPWPISVY